MVEGTKLWGCLREADTCRVPDGGGREKVWSANQPKSQGKAACMAKRCG